jgi:hypothetical protein
MILRSRLANTQAPSCPEVVEDGSPAATQALVGVVAVHRPMRLDRRHQQVVLAGLQRALREKDIAQRAALVEDSGLKGGDEGIVVDEVHLQGQNAKEQMAIERGSGHGSGLGTAVAKLPPLTVSRSNTGREG